MSESAQLMQEPAGGHNHGRTSSANPEVEGRSTPLGVGDWQAAEYMRNNGWTVETGTAHRGVLQPEEHVDAEALRLMVEAELGFTYAQVHSVYRQGPLNADQRILRGRIDARVLTLSDAGGSTALLGRALGFPIKDDGHCRALANALTRAREEGAEMSWTDDTIRGSDADPHVGGEAEPGPNWTDVSDPAYIRAEDV